MILQKFDLRNEEIFPFANIYPPKIFKLAMREKSWFFSILFYFILFYLSYFLLVLFFFFFSLDNWPVNGEFN